MDKINKLVEYAAHMAAVHKESYFTMELADQDALTQVKHGLQDKGYQVVQDNEWLKIWVE